MDTSTPVTPAGSQGDDTQRPESTLPSSPVPDSGEKHAAGEGDARAADMEDMDGMDTKAKALMHLLKTSSVCAIHIIGRRILVGL